MISRTQVSLRPICFDNCCLTTIQQVKVSPLLIKKFAFLTMTNFCFLHRRKFLESLISTNFQTFSFLLVLRCVSPSFHESCRVNLQSPMVFNFGACSWKQPCLSPMSIRYCKLRCFFLEVNLHSII